MASKSVKTTDDRLSTLPDGVISHILSFLPTKFAATTSVLSKRWRFIIHSISRIDIDETWNNSNRLRRLFGEFVSRLLLSPEMSHIHSLRLGCPQLFDSDPINAWIRAAIRRHVEELDISSFRLRSETPPYEIFNSKTLRILKLHGSFTFDVHSSVHMPNLVNLHLHKAKFVDGSCFRRGFSSLKRLSLCYCYMMGSNKVLELVFPSLTNLILHEIEKCVLHTPNLECLEYIGYRTESLQVMNKLNCLVRADLNFRVGNRGFCEYVYRTEAYAENALVYGRYAKMIMKEIHNVKYLRLSGDSLEVLCDSPCPLPTFYNLTTMKLGVNHTVEWRPLAMILESSPNLEVLDFELGLIDRHNNKMVFDYCLPETVPTCLLEHLREINIGYFCGENCEFEVVEYFLRSGKVLEEIKICSKAFRGRPSSLCERLLGCQRGSETCKVLVVCWKDDENFCKRCIN